MVLVKPGVSFSAIAPAGFRILSALESVSRRLGISLTITSACDGEHSGPGDPHHRGEAYDVRSHGVNAKDTVLLAVMRELGEPQPESGGFVTRCFFGWIENAGSDNEHFHFQLRHGAEYTE